MMVFELFSDRELSVIGWLLIILLAVIYQCIKREQIREASINLIKAFFHPKLVFIQFLMLTYIFFQIYALYKFGLWHDGMLGATILWLTVPYFSLYKDLTRNWTEEKYFTNKFKDLFRYTVVLEYISGLKSFPLLAEFIITPIIGFAAVTYAYTENKRELKPAYKLAEWLLIIYGCMILSFSLWHLATNWDFEYLWGFIFAIIMSSAFMPFIWLGRLYFIYQSVFMRITIPHARRQFPKWYAYGMAILAFRTNVIALQRWARHICRHAINSRSDIDASISIIKASMMRERNPRTVALQDGWSPYIIKDCLSEYGLDTEYYDMDTNGEWFASGIPYQFDSETVLENTLTFYVTGTEGCATELKLKFNGNDPANANRDLLHVRNMADELCKAALHQDLPARVGDAIEARTNINCTIQCKNLCVVFERWEASAIADAFEISFIIRN